MGGKLTIVLCAFSLALAAAAAPAASEAPAAAADEEVLEYRWSLQGVAGIFARIFLPGRGDGVLATRGDGAGRVRSELEITSKHSDKGEFWAYGSIIDPSKPAALEVWNSSRFRGRQKKKQSRPAGDGTIDIPSGIYLLRKNPPSEERRMRIWTDGKVYPVAVAPLGLEQGEFGGRPMLLDHYEVRGVEVAGERFWKGSLEVWLARDEARTPVQIVFRHKRGKVRLRLADER